jgi:hypothetical protein
MFVLIAPDMLSYISVRLQLTVRLQLIVTVNSQSKLIAWSTQNGGTSSTFQLTVTVNRNLSFFLTVTVN